MIYKRKKIKEDYYERHKRKQKRRAAWVRMEKGILLALPVLLVIWGISRLLPEKDPESEIKQELTEEYTEAVKETETENERRNHVPQPDIDVQLLSINEFSRPGEETEEIRKIVVHYIGNPGTSAQQNRDYFESLKDLQNASMSSNFIIGMEGEIIECVPPGEVAYASKSMNYYSISVENCHPDTSGKFTDATYRSCVHLVAYLLEEYGLEREDIIRHYDVTGKKCPLYYVENEDRWEKFKDDVMAYIEEEVSD
ncbi:MAG: peptidoglycan recognition family protein [Eubacteriales bacterium]|nr:peptidoglycan recognition family protein [Eubacteriales bacterium]